MSINENDDVELTSYTSESTAAAEAPVASERPALTVPGSAVGRRKEAVARVRLVPGSGQWTINGRALENYFPNKLHQQEVSDPFTLLELTGAYDVIARIHGGGPSGQAGARAAGDDRDAVLGGGAAHELDVLDASGADQRQRGAVAADPRRARHRAQEGRPQEGPQGLAVLEALILRRTVSPPCPRRRPVPLLTSGAGRPPSPWAGGT